MTTAILEMRGITKEFPGVKALNNVTFSVKRGEIHCLVGENGAGKSTLMKVLSGVYPHGSYTGEIGFAGQVQQFRGIRDSERAGIAIIYQELALVPELTVYENIFLGNEVRKGALIDWNETIKRATQMLAKVRLDVNPEAKIKDLGVGKQQLVEIAKALSRDVKLLILDEPTAALNEGDSANLLDLLRGLRDQGVTCILISHKLKEVIAIADSVTVLRDGQTICTLDAHEGEVSEPILIKHMVGREIEQIYPPREHKQPGAVVLEVRDWSAYSPSLGRQVLRNVSFTLRKGEIVGFAGLMGSGRTELALSIFGNSPNYRIEGELQLKGEPRQLRRPSDAIAAGIAYVTEDRKGNGLILIQDVKQNITLANLRALAQRSVIDANAEVKIANEYRTTMNIKTPSVEQRVSNLSGGNQQKVCLSKWLFVKPDVLILDEPTRGIDVGAKYEIYTLMNSLVDQGMSIVMISSELPEVLGMSDRVYVVASGRITGELSVSEATPEKIMELATN
ncbi:ATP-binding cassette domain-containing protein [Candidatus Chloroploca sp. M-50]|uniref:ATP-binding cassette domain-containing protein n=1 Tax=Candidatus Chloroploca mongolica TaxID=2528176 RepID=A0ABS4DGX7_9CHLR|nr:ATP-binding cassette domain-containing protein [Candidatus Chloroploca mongolica]MBP1468644.1 ATP-binding cassette domain-containing protein [Candidatus Chloroploca mongolica]